MSDIASRRSLDAHPRDVETVKFSTLYFSQCTTHLSSFGSVERNDTNSSSPSIVIIKWMTRNINNKCESRGVHVSLVHFTKMRESITLNFA